MTDDRIKYLIMAMFGVKITPTELEVLRTPDEDIEKEYELMKTKKSSLSTHQREGVIALHEILKYYKEV